MATAANTTAAACWSIMDRLGDYLELTKPRIAVLVLVTVAVGGFAGAHGRPDLVVLFHAIVGTALVASGASVLNQYFERHIDAKMHRTAKRPIPSGRIHPIEALVFGIACGVVGTIYMALTVNLLATALAVASFVLYVGVYTPMKQYSTLNTAVGAIPGALPPVIGWTAVTNQLNIDALILFLVVFFWQFPHFFAIAWLYREDYARGGLKMLPTSELGCKLTGLQAVAYALLLIPTSLAPTVLGFASPAYFVGALVFGIQFLGYGIAFQLWQTDAWAKRLLWASLIYLPSVLGLLMADVVRHDYLWR